MSSGCQGHWNEEVLPAALAMAFHPILGQRDRTSWGYKALGPGSPGQSAAEVLAETDEHDGHAFDQTCLVKAEELAGSLFPSDTTRLSIRFLWKAVYESSAVIRAILDAARRAGLDRGRSVFESTSEERMNDPAHLNRIVEAYRRQDIATALDDFGAGNADLNLPVGIQPDIQKIDMGLIQGSANPPARPSIVALAHHLAVTVVVEGVETEAELRTLREFGRALFQGYSFVRPAACEAAGLAVAACVA